MALLALEVGFSIVRFIYGIFFCAVFPALNGMVVRATAPNFRGTAFGLNQTANQLGSMLGPLIGGAISGAFNIHSVFWATGGLLLLTMGYAYWCKLAPDSNQEVQTDLVDG